ATACASTSGAGSALRRRAEASEDSRATNDFRFLRRVERHLDDVETVHRVRLVGWIIVALATGELRLGTGTVAARDVDVDDVLVRRARNDGVRVRSFARLHVLDQLRMRWIRDVEDADAGHVIRRILHAAVGAVVAIAIALGGDEEEMADDRWIALRGDAGD